MIEESEEINPQNISKGLPILYKPFDNFKQKNIYPNQEISNNITEMSTFKKIAKTSEMSMHFRKLPYQAFDLNMSKYFLIFLNFFINFFNKKGFQTKDALSHLDLYQKKKK